MRRVGRAPRVDRHLRDSARFMQVVEELLRHGHSVRFRAHGASMTPAIRDGEVITVAPVGSAEIRIGDVVLYRHGGGALAHRVVRVRSSGGQLVELVPRGDAADLCDAPIAPMRVLGRVVAVERAGVLSRGWSRALGRALRGGRAARAMLASGVGWP